MPVSFELAVQTIFIDAVDQLGEDGLLCLMDDYKAWLCLAAAHGEWDVVRQVEMRVDALTEAYGILQDRWLPGP